MVVTITGQADRRRGFTLVEMSIVLVIIGLLTGAIIGGKRMMDQARYTAWVEQIDSIRSAYAAFYSEYGALPGDYKSATSRLSGATTWDGNGDGRIEGGTGTSTGSGEERVNVFQHLIMAGLLTGDPTKSRQSRSTPVGGVLVRILTLNNGGNGTSVYMEFHNIPSDLVKRLDQDIDDGNPATGAVSNYSTGGSKTNVVVEL